MNVNYIYLLAILLFVGCKKSSNSSDSTHDQTKQSNLIYSVFAGSNLKSSDSVTHSSQEDTLLVFHFRSQNIPMHASKSFSSNYPHFQDLLNQPLQNLHSEEIEIADVTGDGKMDTCISKIFIEQMKPKIIHLIVTDGRVIWKDTHTIEDDEGFTVNWNNDSSYFALKPYSGFQIAKTWYSKFVGEMIDTNSQDFKTVSYFINGNANDEQYWKSYLSTFKGRLILEINPADLGSYIWDSRHQKFILYYSP
jgi:hypothetical protein